MLGYALLAGISAHVLFRRYEPTVLQFLATNLAVFVTPPILDASGTHQSLISGLKHGFLTVTVFNISLALTVILYRLSPGHPLAKYPGPIHLRITKWFMAIWVARGKRHLVLAQLHEKYGPWVRIGPNELSVAQPAAVRPIHSSMFRAPSYQGAPSKADALISTIDRNEHDQRLIAWSKAFSIDSLQRYRTLARNRTDQLIEILSRESANGKGVDISHWVGLWALDIMGDMSFSGGFELMAAGKDTEGWTQVLNQGILFVGIISHVPWMRDVIALLPQPGPIIAFQDFATQKVLERRGSSVCTQDILSIIQDEGSGGPKLSRDEAACDAVFIIIAGSDTISSALTAILRFIIANPEVQQRLRKEISESYQENMDIDDTTLLKLPYLHACIQEGLRITPPVAAGPPRYSGQDGGTILGQFIPPKTTVACPIYTLHRDPKNFVEPDKFIPERWLKDSTLKPHNTDAFVPWANGPGVCIGKPVALYNMKLLVAELLQKFDLSSVKGFDFRGFDNSWKEHNRWEHDPLMVNLASISA